jgi:hypothetical protein
MFTCLLYLFVLFNDAASSWVYVASDISVIIELI